MTDNRDRAFYDIYDAALIDLDGVVYIGDQIVPAADKTIDEVRANGMRCIFITNNAFRTAEQVAARLDAIGVHVDATDVVTSSEAAAQLIAARMPRDSAVLVIGGSGLRQPIHDAGFRVVASADEQPAVVVQGYSPDITYRDLAEATLAVRRGAWWVATNLDATLPDPRGELPGNGSLVALVRTATGCEPDVAGKPERWIIDAALGRVSARNPLVIGDRLDTDIAAAQRAGVDSMLVLTGVSTRDQLHHSPIEQRPTYVAESLAGLLQSPADLAF